MIDSVILPVKFPQVTSYTSIAHLLAILESGDRADNWIYSNFINLWCEVYSPEYTSQLRYENICAFENCPSMKVRYTNRDYLSKINVDLLNAIKAGACLGLYALCAYDEYYLPHSMNYNKKHFNHQCLIYGYDEKEQIFYVADFFFNNRYEFVTVTYEEMSRAINQDAFLLLLYYRTSRMEFNKDELMHNVHDFLNSSFTKKDIILQPLDKKVIAENKMKFGLDCYDLVIEYLADLGKYPVNMRVWLHALYDHKLMMINRIKYLTEKGYLKEDEDTFNMFQEMLSICEVNRNLYIKYQMNKNQKLLEAILSNLRLLKSKDEASMTNFLKLIL